MACQDDKEGHQAGACLAEVTKTTLFNTVLKRNTLIRLIFVQMQ